MLNDIVYSTCRVTINIYAKLFLNLKVSYREKLPQGPKILALNHPTAIDPFIALLLIKEKGYILTWDGNFEIPLVGRIIAYLKHIPVDMDKGSDAYQKALTYLKEGKTLIIFPESDLSPKKDSYTTLKSGSIRLAMETEVPVIPIGIGLHWPRVRVIKTNQRGRKYSRIYSGPYSINIGKPLYFKKETGTKEEVRRGKHKLTIVINDLRKRGNTEVEKALQQKRFKYVLNSALSFLLYRLVRTSDYR